MAVGQSLVALAHQLGIMDAGYHWYCQYHVMGAGCCLVGHGWVTAKLPCAQAACGSAAPGRSGKRRGAGLDSLTPSCRATLSHPKSCRFPPPFLNSLLPRPPTHLQFRCTHTPLCNACTSSTSYVSALVRDRVFHLGTLEGIRIPSRCCSNQAVVAAGTVGVAE